MEKKDIGRNKYLSEHPCYGSQLRNKLSDFVWEIWAFLLAEFHINKILDSKSFTR